MPFAITNRKAAAGFAFGDVPGDTLYYGTVSPKGDSAGFAPVGEGTGAPAEIELFRTLRARLEQSGRNLVFLVNGSGQDFGHVARIGAALEEEYGVEVVLLAWPTAENNIHKYKSHYAYARAAAPMFLGILARWLDIAEKAVAARTIRQVLFCHSLGNQFLEVAAQHPDFDRLTPTFRSVVVNAADVDAGMHALWLSRAGSRVCVVQNANDSVLKQAEGGFLSALVLGENPMRGKKRLGRTIRLATWAPQAAYVDVTQAGETGKQHEYYIGLNPGGRLKALYTMLLSGQTDGPELAALAAQDSKNRNLWILG